MIVPNIPMNPNPRINNPIGMRLAAEVSGKKVGTTNGAGGVKVGRRVGVMGVVNAAARVGSMIEFMVGDGVAGAGKTGRDPGRMIVT